MDILFLGVGAALGSPFLKSCYLVNGRLLIDASPEAAAVLLQHDVDPGSLEAIVLTHLHGDHILGLPLLLADSLRQRAPSLGTRICGPQGTQQTCTSLLDIAYPDIGSEFILNRSKTVFEVLSAGSIIEAGDLHVSAVPASHGRIEAYSLMVEGPEATVFFSGDTCLTDNVRSGARRADFSVLEVTSIEDRSPAHMNLADFHELRRTAPEGKHLFATHRSYRDSPLVSGTVIFPNDFDRYDLRRGSPPILKEHKRFAH